MEFDLQSSRPIWLQLSEQLSRRILTGVYPPGSRFPTVRDLAAEAGVTRCSALSPNWRQTDW